MSIKVSNEYYDVTLRKAPSYDMNSTDNKTYDMRIVAISGMDYSSYELSVENLIDGNAISVILLADYCTDIGKYSAVFRENNLIILLNRAIVSICLENMGYQVALIENPFGTYYDLHLYKDKYIVHGEIEVRMLDEEFKTMWIYSTMDILCGNEPLEIESDVISFYDYDGNFHKIDFEGKPLAFEKYAPKVITIDVSKVNNSKEFQALLKSSLGMPEFYGMNWDAFWDGITGLIEMPDVLELQGWHIYKKKQSKDAKIFEEIMKKYNDLAVYPKCECIYWYYA